MQEEQKRLTMSRAFSSHGATWQYEEHGTWQTLPPEANEQMLQAYLAYLAEPTSDKRVVTITSARVSREVNFERMEQTRYDTGMVRRIRIELGVPGQWTSSPVSLLQQSDQLSSFLVQVSERGIYAKVRDILRFTGHRQPSISPCSYMWNAEIESVYRVEHLGLWQGYKLRREALRKEHALHKVSVTPTALDLEASNQVMTRNQGEFDCGEALAADVDEKILLHGTSWTNAQSIILNGFDHRTSRRGMYGEGVYFASASCKSHQYTCQMHSQGCACAHERTLIISRVMLGDACHAKETLRQERRPPVRDSSLGVTYDSVVVYPGPIRGHHNQIQVHQEFVIFDRDQAFPCYVVRYVVWIKCLKGDFRSHVALCQCKLCRRKRCNAQWDTLLQCCFNGVQRQDIMSQRAEPGSRYGRMVMGLKENP